MKRRPRRPGRSPSRAAHVGQETSPCDPVTLQKEYQRGSHQGALNGIVSGMLIGVSLAGLFFSMHRVASDMES